MLELTFNNAIGEKEFSQAFFEQLTKAALVAFGLSKGKIGLSINLVGEGRIRFLNNKYRKKNKATDALSFPLFDKSNLEDYLKNRDGAKKSKTDIIELGDIFICLPVIRRQAHEEKKNLKFLVSFLTVHSFLHLFGFDHEEEKDRRKMEKMERHLLSNL